MSLIFGQPKLPLAESQPSLLPKRQRDADCLPDSLDLEPEKPGRKRRRAGELPPKLAAILANEKADVSEEVLSTEPFPLL